MLSEYSYILPDKIWVIEIETSAITRINCSPLDHDEEGSTAYVREDLVDRLTGALRNHVYEHGPLTEDELDILDLLDSSNDA